MVVCQPEYKSEISLYTLLFPFYEHFCVHGLCQIRSEHAIGPLGKSIPAKSGMIFKIPHSGYAGVSNFNELWEVKMVNYNIMKGRLVY